MKVSLALLVAVIGFSLVAAEYNLEERLKMALKRLLQGVPEGKKEDLEMETRDGFADCERDTKKCDGNGKCQKSAPGGSYICFCDAGYVSNSYGGCSVPEGKKEDLEMETRDGFADCERDTKKCDGNGKCQKSASGGSYICFCDAGYVSNSYGGCSVPEGKKEDLEMETRDGFADCERDTKKCDGNGKCQKSAPGGSYICFCDAGYVSNSYGGCSEADAREIEYLSNIARDVELEMLTRDTLARCNRDTKNCDGFGRCEKSTFGRTTGQYICKCNEGYDNNVYGGCSPRPSDQDEGGENEREFKLDILRRLVNLLAE